MGHRLYLPTAMKKSEFGSTCWPSCVEHGSVNYDKQIHVEWIVGLCKCFGTFSPQEHDEPILKHLQDIKVKFSDPGQPMVSEHDSCETSPLCLNCL